MRVYEIGGPDQMSYEDIVRTIKSALGLHRKIVHVPVPMMMPPAFFMEKLLRHAPVTRDQLRMLGAQQHHPRRLGACRLRLRRGELRRTTATTSRTTDRGCRRSSRRAGHRHPRDHAPVANYVTARQADNLLFLSGHLGKRDGAVVTGRVGDDVDTDTAYDLARRARHRSPRDRPRGTWHARHRRGGQAHRLRPERAGIHRAVRSHQRGVRPAGGRASARTAGGTLGARSGSRSCRWDAAVELEAIFEVIGAPA